MLYRVLALAALFALSACGMPYSAGWEISGTTTKRFPFSELDPNDRNTPVGFYGPLKCREDFSVGKTKSTAFGHLMEASAWDEYYAECYRERPRHRGRTRTFRKKLF